MQKNIAKLPHKKHYYHAVAKNILLASSIILFSLILGIAGYYYFFQLDFYDSLLNASMILTGMGPVNAALSNGAKVFASFYALYSGIAFLSCVALIFSPLLRRFLHRFHLDIQN